MTRKDFDASVNGWVGHAVQANTARLRQELQEKFGEMEIKLYF